MEEDKAALKFWKEYYSPMETAAYRHILTEKAKSGEESGVWTFNSSCSEFEKLFGMPLYCVAGFLDGINESVVSAPDEDFIRNMKEDSAFSLEIDFEKLFRKMVEYQAAYLFELKEWSGVFSVAKLRSLYKEQRETKTIVRSEKVGRNDPCPCGSGKKYKKCCGAASAGEVSGE
jgi:hypothetical protein